MKKDDIEDFGFSLVDENQLKEYEKKLIEDLSKDKLSYANETELYKVKFDKLKNMIMPLLHNLSKDETKTYIFWPNRSVKLKKLIDDIENLT